VVDLNPLTLGHQQIMIAVWTFHSYRYSEVKVTRLRVGIAEVQSPCLEKIFNSKNLRYLIENYLFGIADCSKAEQSA